MIDIIIAPDRKSLHWTRGEISWAELSSWAEEPARKKECGNYLLGTIRETTEIHKGYTTPCTALHRNKAAIVTRSAVTLDADSATPDLVDRIEMLLGAAIIHTTYSSAPDNLRLRVILPISRPLLPDEYHYVAEKLLDRLGRGYFDPGSSQPERYMFRPAASNLEWYQRWVFEGDPVDVDEILEGWETDLAHAPLPKISRNKRDPFEIEGVVGAFNRAYSIEDAIEAFDIPYKAVSEGRWQLIGARAEAGVSLVSEGLVYSHHVTDPAGGKTCSAFDLVRLHRFAYLDEDKPDSTPVNRLPSHEAMVELASTDARTLAELVGVDFSEETEEEVGWKLSLRFHPRTGQLKDEIGNWDLIQANDPVFAGLFWNELTLAVETDRDLPWRSLTKGSIFTETDRAALLFHIEREYKIRPARALLDGLVNVRAHQRPVNPIRDYLVGLEWDGVPRVEEALPGVVPTDYTRMVARKCFTAAAARILSPGIKWDHTLVLYGDEGLGKSFWIEKIARGYASTLGRISDKDTLITMQRSWIMTSDEGYSLRKSDADATKEFLTRTEDAFRMPYDREVSVHPRHCVIWGTTNDEVFLRRQGGNRRFLIVHCEGKVDFSMVTDDYIDQLWAEAVSLYLNGEPLYLDSDQSAVASVERERFVEEDALAGLIQEYLDLPVPDDWDNKSPESRTEWARNFREGFAPRGDGQINKICSTQIWVEALGRPLGDRRRADLLEITTALKSLPGWRILPSRHRIPFYGPQTVFVRASSEDEDPFDLL